MVWKELDDEGFVQAPTANTKSWAYGDRVLGSCRRAAGTAPAEEFRGHPRCQLGTVKTTQPHETKVFARLGLTEDEISRESPSSITISIAMSSYQKGYDVHSEIWDRSWVCRVQAMTPAQERDSITVSVWTFPQPNWNDYREESGLRSGECDHGRRGFGYFFYSGTTHHQCHRARAGSQTWT